MRNRFSWKYLFFSGYIVVVILSILNHEPWRDEAQAWLIVRDLPPGRLFAQANYEGTPMLWHLLLLPLVKLQAPYLTMHLLHAGFAIGTVYLILFRSPFPAVLSVLIAGSYYLSWEYAVIARNYNLSVLLLCGIAALYHKKLQYPRYYAVLLLLLFNTNVHSMGLAAGLAIAFGYELYHEKGAGPARTLSIVTVVAGFVLAIFQLLPAPDNVNQGFVYQLNWKRPAVALGNAFFPALPGDFYITILLALILVSLLVFSLVRHRAWDVLFIGAMGFFGMAYIFACRHPGSLRHHGLLLIIVLFIWWVHRPAQQLLERAWQAGLCVCLGLSVWAGVGNHLRELAKPFSGAEEAAGFLAEALKPDDVVIAHPSIKASAMLPYLPDRRFWYAEVGAMGSYITWNTRYEAGKSVDVARAIRTGVSKLESGAERIYVVLDAPLPAELGSRFEPVFRTREAVWGYGDEVYFIYRKRPPIP